MTVEHIIHNPNEILDLTGGSNEPTTEEVQTGEEQVLDTTVEKDVSVVNSDDTKTTEEGANVLDADTSDTTVDGDESTDAVAEEGEFFFGGNQVDIEVPTEIASALEEAGIDKNALLAELFSKDGDFSISDDTRVKLEEKFGKLMVDGYLNMYKGINEQSAAKSNSEKEATTLLETKRDTEYSDMVGGEEGLVKLEDYVVGAYSEEQVAAYNTVMESGDHGSQMLILSQVKMQMELQNKLTNGDTNIKLIGDNSSSNLAASPLDKGTLTSQEYDKIMESDKYWTDRDYMRQVDAARSAGIRLQG